MTLRMWSAGPALLLMLAATPAFAAPGDAAKGATFFKQRCMMCHVTAKGAKATIGPNLSGLKGSVSGTGGYAFSAALKKAAIKWDAPVLDKFLKAPSKTVPGTRMITAIPNDADRANVISYLMTL